MALKQIYSRPVTQTEEELIRFHSDFRVPEFLEGLDNEIASEQKKIARTPPDKFLSRYQPLRLLRHLEAYCVDLNAMLMRRTLVHAFPHDPAKVREQVGILQQTIWKRPENPPTVRRMVRASGGWKRTPLQHLVYVSARKSYTRTSNFSSFHFSCWIAISMLGSWSSMASSSADLG
jgi:hypothetical protein